MNDQAKKLRELAQKIREERDRASLIFDPTARRSEKNLSGWDITPMPKNTTSSTMGDIIAHLETSGIARRPKTPTTTPTQAPRQIPATRVIAVSSGKGGVGKSNLVANLGIALSKRGRKVMVFDADLGLANIDVLFDINPKYNLKQLVDGDKTLPEILVKGPYSLTIVPGGSGIPELANLSDEQQQKLLENFSSLEREFDITLIDTGAGISKDIISFILAAREAIIITTPEPTAITDAYGMIKVLTQRDSSVDIKLVVNMVSDEKEGQDIANRIIMATKQFLGKRIEALGYIVTDPSVSMSVVKQSPLILGYPNSRAAKCIMQIAETIDRTSTKDSRQIAKRNGFRGFLSRFFER